MSSIPRESCISSADLEMLQSILCDIGFTRDALESDASHFNAAALKIMTLYLNGMTNRGELRSEMVFYFGVQKRRVDAIVPQLPRYAIQGMPGCSPAHH